MIDALDQQEQIEHETLVGELSGLDTAERVIRAFTVKPMTETEAKLVQVLLDNPGSTSTALTQALGWKAQSWVQETQPKAWEALSRSHGSGAEAALLDRVRKQIDDRGTLDVIRHGVEMVGVRGMISLAQFKPAMGMNPDITAAYQANRLRVVRQIRYSVANENCFDLAFFLNGVPVATAELKTDFTQSITDAIDQYRFDRLPRPKGGNPEPLLTFPSGALVHFAVSNSEVHMTTKLAGPTTRFLPFNQGDAGGAGNPLNEHGHRTAYLWEEVWERESWLEIIGRYLVAQRDTKRAISGLTCGSNGCDMPLRA